MAARLPEGFRAWVDQQLAGERVVDTRLLPDADTQIPAFFTHLNLAAANDIRLDLASAERDGSRMLRRSLDAGFAALLGEEQELN